jgi:hypothetical protein
MTFSFKVIADLIRNLFPTKVIAGFDPQSIPSNVIPCLTRNPLPPMSFRTWCGIYLCNRCWSRWNQGSGWLLSIVIAGLTRNLFMN